MQGGTALPPVLLQPPSFVATHDFFAKITQILDFFAFPNFRKAAKFAAFIERPKTKSASASRGLRPPDQGPCPWTPLGLCPQAPVIGSRYHARHRAGTRASPDIAG